LPTKAKSPEDSLVPTNQQRREAERRRLQRQLEERRAREAARKRNTLIGSVVGTVLLIGLIVGIVVAFAGGGSDKNGTNAAGSPTAAVSPTASVSTSPIPATPLAPCAKPPAGSTASFHGVTVKGAKDIKHAPKVDSLSETDPPDLLCQDLVIGSGKAATPKSTVSVQYVGVLYKDGGQFDSSWSRGGKPISFPLTRVVRGFTEGIGGAGKIAPMKVGGRRIMILPSSLGYGSTPNAGIPANSALVFVVDLKSAK
jgi:peptidylprolyl isomerase